MAKGKNKNAKTEARESTKNLQLIRRAPNIGNWLGAPGDLMGRFRDEMDRLFENFGFGNLTRTFPLRESFGLSAWSPQVEVIKREGELMIRADLPGLKKDEVKVDLADDPVTIEGERKQEHEERDEGFYRSERSYGHFYRRIPLPEGVDLDTARANFRDGVLEITMAAPEVKERKARKLEIADESATAKAKAAGAVR
jgi:HSP20 family protein